ncbi:hypothetical protein B0T11DRAFT_124274 [Plectosphaerella cucumerina]|uniref:Uncharacterized protein n=1 Tax=Plectosphaerella cucumerina TaxID=40658 RepID=A0A8K0TA58_9PEZI|nr:hypothetical protein B0T11DRAFT_124274 [Plectosphaerella cucumerina]
MLLLDAVSYLLSARLPARFGNVPVRSHPHRRRAGSTAVDLSPLLMASSVALALALAAGSSVQSMTCVAVSTVTTTTSILRAKTSPSPQALSTAVGRMLGASDEAREPRRTRPFVRVLLRGIPIGPMTATGRLGARVSPHFLLGCCFLFAASVQQLDTGTRRTAHRSTGTRRHAMPYHAAYRRKEWKGIACPDSRGPATTAGTCSFSATSSSESMRRVGENWLAPWTGV